MPEGTLNLVYLRASQINGCSVCVDMHARDAKKAGDTDQEREGARPVPCSPAMGFLSQGRNDG